MKLWQRHILLRLIRTFFFFLASLLSIYVIIDLSAHGVRFFAKSNMADILLYYLNTFSTQLDLFLSLTFLLSALKVLVDLNIYRELVALQMAGISKKKLLSPFFLWAFCLGVISYANSQWCIPHAGKYSNDFKASYKAKKKVKTPKLYSTPLEDQSELIYRAFDPIKEELIDVFWVRSPNDIWHMKTLQMSSLEGQFVHHLVRSENQLLTKQQSLPCKHFSEISWDPNVALHHFIPYESRPLSTLLVQAYGRPADMRIVCSHLYYKLLTPLIPCLIVIAIGPVVLRYTRKLAVALFFAIGIFGLLSLKTILDGMLILGENQVLPSYVAIFSPIVVVLLGAFPRFARMR